MNIDWLLFLPPGGSGGDAGGTFLAVDVYAHARQTGHAEAHTENKQPHTETPPPPVSNSHS